jgi:hypothetical protein
MVQGIYIYIYTIYNLSILYTIENKITLNVLHDLAILDYLHVNFATWHCLIYTHTFKLFYVQ